MRSCLPVCFPRPEQFTDTITAGGKTEENSIPDDMLPPSDSESDMSDTGDLGPVCNPNRQQRLREADGVEDSNNSDDSDDQQKWMCIHFIII